MHMDAVCMLSTLLYIASRASQWGWETCLAFVRGPAFHRLQQPQVEGCLILVLHPHGTGTITRHTVVPCSVQLVAEVQRLRGVDAVVRVHACDAVALRQHIVC